MLRRRKTALATRDWTLRGMTTEGASRAPTPLAEVLSEVPHQIGQLPVGKATVKAVLSAVSSARKRLAVKPPPIAQGASEHEGGQAGHSQDKALGTTERRFVPASAFVRQALLEQK